MRLNESLIGEIDAVLPQTQCGQCGFAGCEPYARAIVEGNADINQCPPGDTAGIRKIAALLGVEPKPLNTRHGQPKPRALAAIDESRCIGCTFCIQACPVDAIVGAAKRMHTVLADECTGCELCVAPCPMDCIAMVPATQPRGSADDIAAELKRKADQARSRYRFRQQRLQQKIRREDHPAVTTGPLTEMPRAIAKPSPLHNDDRKHDIVRAALKRAAAMRAQGEK